MDTLTESPQISTLDVYYSSSSPQENPGLVCSYPPASFLGLGLNATIFHYSHWNPPKGNPGCSKRVPNTGSGNSTSLYSSSNEPSPSSKANKQKIIKQTINNLQNLTSKDAKYIGNLAIKCKRDWKKIAQKFSKHKDRVYEPQELRAMYNSCSFKRQNQRAKFTCEDDVKLKQCVDQQGLNWVKIAESFPGKCPLSLRNRYYAKIRSSSDTASKSSDTKTTKKTNNQQKYKLAVGRGEPKINLSILIDDLVLDESPVCLEFINDLLEKATF